MTRRILLLAALLLLLAGLALAWLLGSTHGARWLVGRAGAGAPGLSIAAVEGSLGGTLRFADVRWTDGRTTVEVQRLDARIALPPLFAGRIVVPTLEAEGLAVSVRDAEEPAGPRAAESPSRLPAVTIDALRIAGSRIEVGGRTLALDRIDGRFAMGGARIGLQDFTVAGPDGRADGTLSLDLDRELPLASADLRFDLAFDGRRLAGSAALRPSADGDAIAIALSAPLQATLDGTADSGWTRASLVLRLPAQAGTPLGIDERIAADLRAELADARWQPRGTLAVGVDVLAIDDGSLRLDDAAIQVDALRLASPRHGALRIDGVVPRDAAGEWSLRLATDELRWPRSGAEPLRIAGSATVAGPARAPSLRPDLRLSAPGVPEARLAGTLAYDGDRIRVDGLSLDAAPARARLDGILSFGQPARIEAQVLDLDPALFVPDWPGAVDARLDFDGVLGADGPSGTLQLRELGGTLRGRALAGEACLQVRDGRWIDGTAVLSSGSARLDAQARDGGAWIDLRAEIPDLADLWPGASGSVSGSWRREAGDQIALRARALALDGLALARLDASARRGSGRDPALSARVEAGAITVRGQSLDLLRIEAEGTLGEQVVLLSVDDPARGGSARFAGGWRDGAWSGTLDALEARAAGASLRLREPAALIVGGQSSRLAPACFDTTGGRICLEATHAADGGAATLELEGLSLAALRAWLTDPRIPALEGLASGNATARWDARGLAEASARLDSPRGLARLPKRPDLDLGYADLALEARWDGDAGRIEGGARLVPEGRIDLGADLSRIGGGIGIDATVDLRITDLTAIEAFTTTIAEPEGELRGQLRLRGGALPESVSGALALTGFTAQVPAQALRLREGVLVLAGVPGQLVLRGSVLSGDGRLTIDGRIDRDDPVPALLRVGGERFRVANTPHLSLLASPDLTLALRDGRWQLEGSLDIPRARIDAGKLETSADRSPDVVVVDDPEPPDPRRPWRARVRVSLGEDVRLSGFGFDGTLQGALDVAQRQGAQALASGEVTVLGRYAAYGQRLEIKRGGLRWANSPLAEPTLDLRAERKVRGETVALEVRGSAGNPTSQVVAAPGTSDSEALALLVTGRPLNRAGAEDRQRLSDASAALGAVGSQLLTRSLGGRLGLDEIGVSNDTHLDGEAFSLGKYLSPRLYVGYGIGILTRGEVFTVRYLVTDRIEIEANAGATQRAAVNWRIER